MLAAPTDRKTPLSGIKRTGLARTVGCQRLIAARPHPRLGGEAPWVSDPGCRARKYRAAPDAGERLRLGEASGQRAAKTVKPWRRWGSATRGPSPGLLLPLLLPYRHANRLQPTARDRHRQTRPPWSNFLLGLALRPDCTLGQQLVGEQRLRPETASQPSNRGSNPRSATKVKQARRRGQPRGLCCL